MFLEILQLNGDGIIRAFENHREGILKKAILVFKFLLVFAWAGLFGLVLATPPSLLWFIIVILPLIMMWIMAYVTYSVSGHEPHTQAVKRHLWLAIFSDGLPFGHAVAPRGFLLCPSVMPVHLHFI